MTKIPERNLNPPPNGWIECPECLASCWFKGQWCPTCFGEGVIPKAEVERELDAAQADKAHDAKMEEEP